MKRAQAGFHTWPCSLRDLAIEALCGRDVSQG